MYKKFIKNKSVVCFDLDGTIVDNEGMYVQAFEIVLDKVAPNLSLSEIYGQSGEALDIKWQRVLATHLVKEKLTTKDLTNFTYNEYVKLVNNATLEPREGFWQLVAYLKEEKGMKIALTTNTDKVIAQYMIKKLEIQDMFDFAIYGDEVAKKKPNPEIFYAAAKFFKVKPRELLIFEDSLAGATAAAASGASLIVIWDGQTNKRLFPEQTMLFTDDFVGLAYNMDISGDEYLEAIQKAMPPSPNQQIQK